MLLWVLLLLSVVQLGATGLLLLRGQKPQPTAVAPVPFQPAIPSTFDTSTLLLCEPLHRAIRHEVSVHCQKPPTSYQYAGKTYRYRSKLGHQRYEFVEVR